MNAVVGLDPVDFHLIFDESDEISRVDVHRLALAVVEHNDEVEKVRLA